MDASMTPGTNPITGGQKDAIKALLNGTAADIITEVLKEDRHFAQRLLEGGDDFRTIIFDAARKVSQGGQYADEEISSDYTYPDGYAIRPIAEQVTKLQELFPKLNGANLEIANGELPEGAEGWFAIPRWDKLGKIYNEAFKQQIIPVLAKIFPRFHNYRKGELSAKYLRQHQRTIEMWEQIATEQKGHDILIVPAQFGLRHRGRSVRRAREMFDANEFGLGAFATGCMLLTHPDRLVCWEQLHFDCAGDEYDWDADGDWTISPYFHFRDDRVRFSARYVYDVNGRFGASSAFLGSVSGS